MNEEEWRDYDHATMDHDLEVIHQWIEEGCPNRRTYELNLAHVRLRGWLRRVWRAANADQAQG